jgi:hypothetical protein
MKLENKQEERDNQAPLTTFSKVSNLKVPDSPPPEKKEEPEAAGGMSKFE